MLFIAIILYMIKKFDLILSVITIPVDYLMLILSGVFVYYLRFSALVELRPVIFEIPFIKYFYSLIILFFGWIIIFSMTGLYNMGKRRHFSKEFSKIFLSSSMGIMMVVLFIFFKREYFSSRFIILAGWITSIFFVSIGRILLHWIRLGYYKKGKGLEPILIHGSSELSDKILNFIKKNPGHGYKILGKYDNVEKLINQWKSSPRAITQIIQTDPDISKKDVLRLIGFCRANQILFKYAADIFDALSSNIKTETIAGIPIIVVQKTSLDGWGRVSKRFFDLILALSGITFCLPLFLILSIIIKIDSPGPVFVKLKRIGQRGELFELYKFRSMVKNAHQNKQALARYNERQTGPLFKMSADPRITKFGKFLRKFSIDELPQLFNVIQGKMSLIGPRPHEPEEVSRYKNYHKQLLAIKPGITGMAQISGRAELSFDEEAKLDIYYIENWSLLFDLQIFLKTIPVVLSHKGAC